MIYSNERMYMENSQFLIRVVERQDDMDLWKVYRDKKAVPYFNSDNCHGDTFYYQTLERMQEAIEFWIDNYEHHHFVRFIILDKNTNVAIGTIELFKRSSNDYYHGKAILRLDLRSDFEKTHVIESIINLLLPNIFTICHSNDIVTKIPNFALARKAAFTALGFVTTTEKLIGFDGTSYDNYYILHTKNN